MFGIICNIRNKAVTFKKYYEIFKRSGEEYMTERKVIKVKRQAIRRARLKKVGTVAAMLPLVISKGAPVATLIRGRHGEAALGIEQVVERAEQEIADVVLPETPAEEVLEEKEYGGVEEREVQEAPTPFEAHNTL